MQLRSFYINLDRRPDRRAQFEECSRRAGIEVERFAALDGRVVDVPESRGDDERGVYAQILSHKAVLERAKAQSLPMVMIFEDDALFPEWFQSEVEHFLSVVPNDWGLVYFGGHGWARRWGHVKGPVLRSTHIQNTECYVVRNPYYNWVISELARCAPLREHWADRIIGGLQGRIPTYTMLNPIVRQSVDFSDTYNRRANDYPARCDIPGTFTDAEGEEYVRQVRRSAKPVVAQIGAQRGREASFVAELVDRRGGAIFAFDDGCEPALWGEFEWWMNAAGLRPVVQDVRMDPRKAAAYFHDASFDTVMVAMKRTRQETAQIIETWLPKLRTGGVMMGYGFDAESRGAADDACGAAMDLAGRLWFHRR